MDDDQQKDKYAGNKHECGSVGATEDGFHRFAVLSASLVCTKIRNDVVVHLPILCFFLPKWIIFNKWELSVSD
jgi:hypothetical protein